MVDDAKTIDLNVNIDLRIPGADAIQSWSEKIAAMMAEQEDEGLIYDSEA